jgi:chromosome segregation ATPase
MKEYIFLGLFIAVALLSGCLELPMIKRSPQKTEQGLYTKVPAAMQAGVREAEYDLKKAKAQVDLASEKVKLAEMRKEMAILEKNYADFEMQMAETLVKEVELKLERKKLEAVDNSNLGDKEENIKRIANLKKQELSVESENIQIQSELDILDMKIKKLAKEINQKKTRLAKKK